MFFVRFASNIPSAFDHKLNFASGLITSAGIVNIQTHGFTYNKQAITETA